MKRRDLLKTAAKGAAAAIMTPAVTRVAAAATMIHRGRYRLSAASEQTYSARAVELVQRSTVIDMLAPLWLSLPKLKKMLMNPENFNAEDFASYKESGINVFHIADGIEGPDAYLRTLQFLSGYNTFLLRHDAWFEPWKRPRGWTGSSPRARSAFSSACKMPNIFARLTT